jgi:two-component system, NarL family, sensor histidine kinase UhpB
VQPLLDAEFEVAGCYLLSSDDARTRVPARLIGHHSESNGRGPYAWSHHWLVVPLRDASGAIIGLIWADDPIDLLLPSGPRLEALRTFANQAAAAIESNGREAKLRLSEERFRKVFEEGPLGMKLIGPDLRFVDVNESFCRLLGYDRADLRGRSIADVTYEEDIDVDVELASQLFRGEITSYRLEKRYLTKAGAVVWVDVAATVIRNERGEPAYGLGIVEDVTERRRVREELEQAHEARRDMLKRVVEVAESERRRLAADLHDGPIQRLSALTVRLETARGAAAREDWPAYTKALATTQESLQGEVNRLRRLMKDLRPPVLDERGLTVALRGLAQEFRTTSGLRVNVSAPWGHLADLEPERETALYRIAQEALTNVAKHARATEASITVTMDGRTLRIEIADNGSGFDPEQIVVADGHFGLVTMRERAEMAGGTLSIETRNGRGTCVRVLVPLSARAEWVA